MGSAVEDTGGWRFIGQQPSAALALSAFLLGLPTAPPPTEARGAVRFPSRQMGPRTPHPDSNLREGGGSWEAKREHSFLSQVPLRWNFPTLTWSLYLWKCRWHGVGTELGCLGPAEPASGLRPLPGAGGRLHSPPFLCILP